MRARHYAAAKGWEVVAVYDLAGVSGKSVMEHPETKHMMEDVRKGNITALVFSKLARLTRNARELMDFADFFRQHNADLISLQENVDTSTPSGRMFYNMVAVMAQWEREEIADRVKASISVRAKLGKPLNGRAPFGYHWHEKKLQPHPDEAPIRRLMYELFLEHRRVKTVARILNERGYRTRVKAKFSDTTVERLIQDPTAKGMHRANFTKRMGDDRPWALKPENEWVITPVEPIVSDKLWDECNELLESRRVTQKRPSKRAVHLFAGLVFCHCGKKMYVPSNSPKYICTACRNKIPTTDLEGIFVEQLKNYLVTPSNVEKYLAGANEALNEKRTLVESLRKDHERVKRESDRVYELYAQGGLTVPQFKERYNPLDERKKQIEEELPRIQAEIDLLSIDGLSSEQIMSEATDLHSRWPKLPKEEQRRMVELLAQSLTVGVDKVSISLCYIPSFEKMTEGQRTL